jgi:hypothetical protein
MMNLRLSGEDIRIRVSSDEFQRLLHSGSVSLEVPLPRLHVFRVSVRVSPIGGWELESDPTGLWLTIPRSRLEEFAQELPSKEGIAHEFESGHSQPLRAVFEVDLRG